MVFKKQEPKEEVKEEVKPSVNEATLVEVPTQTALVFKTETGEILDEREFMLKMYNMILAVKKAVV